MLLANDKTLQELENREISVIDCISNKAVLVMGSAEERYAMINTILDSIRVDFPEDQARDEDDPRYILRSVEHDRVSHPPRALALSASQRFARSGHLLCS